MESWITSPNKGYAVKLFSIGSIFWIAFTDRPSIRSASEIDPESMKIFSSFYHALLDNGIYTGPSGYEVGFVSAAHSDAHIDDAVAAFNRSLDIAFE